jgi:hypothetical protein
VEHFAIAAGGSLFGQFFPVRNDTLFGGRLSAFLPLITHELELQAAVGLLRYDGDRDDSWLLPVDLYLRRPVYISRIVEPYVAGGPRVELLQGAPKLGGGLSLGVDLFFSQSVGAFVEGQAALMGRYGSVGPEAGATGGLLFGL